MTEPSDRNAFIERGRAVRAGRAQPARGELAPTILVATDFSTAADVAVDAAVGLAVKLEARIVVLHLLSLAPLAHADFVWVPTSHEIEVSTRKAQEALRATAARIAAMETRVVVDSALVYGLMPNDLLLAIEQRRPDLVVVGTHGRGFWSNLVLGGVARSIARNATVPVLTVRPEGLDPEATTILVAVELGDVVQDALDFAAGLAITMGTKLRLLYVFPGADEIGVGGGGEDMEAEIASKARMALEQLAGPEGSRAVRIESATRFGRPARQIAEEAKACNAAYVVMGTHARGFVERTVSGSVAEDVLQIAGRAVVTCRVPAGG